MQKTKKNIHYKDIRDKNECERKKKGEIKGRIRRDE